MNHSINEAKFYKYKFGTYRNECYLQAENMNFIKYNR